jgi:hypothetical protein
VGEGFKNEIAGRRISCDSAVLIVNLIDRISPRIRKLIVGRFYVRKCVFWRLSKYAVSLCGSILFLIRKIQK